MSVRTKYYLDKRNAKFMGVLAGIADYFGIETMWTRVGFMAALLIAQLWFLVPLYFLVGWFADRKPDALYSDSRDEQKFYANLRTSPKRTIRDTRSMYRDVDRRLQDIEAYMTSSNSRLGAEIDALR